MTARGLRAGRLPSLTPRGIAARRVTSELDEILLISNERMPSRPGIEFAAGPSRPKWPLSRQTERSDRPSISAASPTPSSPTSTFVITHARCSSVLVIVIVSFISGD